MLLAFSAFFVYTDTMMEVKMLEDLQDDGDTVDLNDGRKLRLRIEPDQDTDINDFDCYGKVEWGRKNDYGEMRPDGFTGNAEKLGIYDHGVSLWWEPPEGLMAKRGTPEWIAERAAIRELAQYGFHGVILELLEGTDAYRRPIVRESASLWGIDSVDREYLKEILSDLVSELGVKVV